MRRPITYTDGQKAQLRALLQNDKLEVPVRAAGFFAQYGLAEIVPAPGGIHRVGHTWITLTATGREVARKL